MITGTITLTGKALLLAEDIRLNIENAMEEKCEDKFFHVRLDGDIAWDRIALRKTILSKVPNVTYLSIRKVKNLKMFYPKHFIQVKGKVSA